LRISSRAVVVARWGRPPLRAIVAVAAGKALGVASRRLGRGGGTALPGAVAQRIEPRLASRLARQLGRGRAMVTGTNGKTTTARMLAEIAAAAGAAPVHNRSGSNLMRGVGTALLDAAAFDGRIPRAAGRCGVFEVDEATVPAAIRALRPSVVIYTNLFRDQLDRYGEVDSIRGLWRSSLRQLPAGATIVVNVDDPSVAELVDGYAGPVLAFSVDAGGAEPTSGSVAEHAADARWCHACGAEYLYDPIYFGHIGRWRCPGCGRLPPEPDLRVARIGPAFGAAGQALVVDVRGVRLAFTLPLDGLYNAYNAAAALTGALALGFDLAVAVHELERFSAAFGRQERLALAGREVRLLLCKNPAGMNQALAAVLADDQPLHLLIALNDRVQDGRDISWIWDVDFERLVGRTAAAVACGTRASDLALRLKYAGFGAALTVERDAAAALDRALGATPAGGRLYVLPTYTAMLALRDLVARRGGRPAFWQQ
jgi:UDP-N-acetylmuramyl tripeptide synthase